MFSDKLLFSSAQQVTSHSSCAPAVSAFLVYRRNRRLCSRHCVDLNNAICCSLAFRSSSTQHVALHTVSSAVGTASTSIMRFIAGWPFSVRQTSYFVDGFKFVVNTWEYKDMPWPDLMSLPLPVSPLLLSVLRPSPCPKRPSTYF